MNAHSRTSTEPAAPPDLDALIKEGLDATGILPPYGRLVDLDTQLRAAIRRLSRRAQTEADAMDRGTPEWYSLQTAVDNARQALDESLGPGLRSAALHVSELARRCHALHLKTSPSSGPAARRGEAAPDAPFERP